MELTPDYVKLGYRFYLAGIPVGQTDYILMRQTPREQRLASYDELSDALVRGHEVTFNARLSACTSQGQQSTDITEHGGKVLNFQTFADHLKFSSQRMYANGRSISCCTLGPSTF